MHGEARHGQSPTQPEHDTARAWRGVARRDVARRDVARRDVARRGVARRDVARRDTLYRNQVAATVVMTHW
jgi:sulfur relay (sulfurtransferase) complex TusBCD TusD component (DsrE family)